MVRSVLANRKIENYLVTLAESRKFSYGIIVGQSCQASHKDYVVHLARTLEVPFNSLDNLNLPSSEFTVNISKDQNLLTTQSTEYNLAFEPETLETFDGHNLVNHSVSVTRMLPGSFYVLGIFAVTENNLFQDDEGLNKFKTVFREINRALDIHKHFCGRHPNYEENLFLNYVWTKSKFECKSYNSRLDPELVHWKFLDKPTMWHMFETNYELDDIFPVIERQSCLNLESNFNASLALISDYVENSTIFVENDSVDQDQTLDMYIKEKFGTKYINETFKAYILDLTSVSNFSNPKLIRFHGTIHYVGTIFSRIWVHPKCTFKDIQQFIRNDIIRSLASRIQIFCDGLSNPNSAKDVIVINIPPKRVFFDIPDSGGIQFSEYIFNGENSKTVLDQVKDILDLNISETNVRLDLEALPDYDDTIPILEATSTPTDSKTSIKNNDEIDENYKLIYVGGIAIAIGILIISILLHFIWR